MSCLPWTLKIADLSAGQQESIEIAERIGSDFQEIIVVRLTRSLREGPEWTVDAQQVSWLLGSLPAADVVALLEPVFAWLEDASLADDEDDPSSTAVVIEVLVRLLDTDGLVDNEETFRLLGAIFDGMLGAPEVNGCTRGVGRTTPQTATCSYTGFDYGVPLLALDRQAQLWSVA